ncbi:MAG: hypothetical protein ABW110_17100 [Steroidobacteraceae bacterium]
MSESVGSLLSDVLENNRKALKSVIEAYRLGGVRLAQGVGVRLERALEEGAGRLNKNLRVTLVDSSGKVRDFCSQRIEDVSAGADKTVNKFYDTAISAVEIVGERVVAVENPYAQKYLGYVEKAALPSVKLARDLSVRVAQGAETAYERIAPKRKTRTTTVTKAKRRSTRRRAKRA